MYGNKMVRVDGRSCCCRLYYWIMLLLYVWVPDSGTWFVGAFCTISRGTIRSIVSQPPYRVSRFRLAFRGSNETDEGDDTTSTVTEQMDKDDDKDDCGYQGSQSTLWLEDATDALLDLDEYPLGSLSPPDMEIMDDLLSTWPRRRSVHAALAVEKLLKRIVDELHVNESIQLETKLYSYAIEAWARSRAKGAAERAQSIHNALVQNWMDDGMGKNMAPTTDSYNSLLAAWSHSSPARVEEILQEMVYLYQDGRHECVKPDDTTFITIFETYLRNLSSGLDSAQNQRAIDRCEELHKLMKDLGVFESVPFLSMFQSLYSRTGLEGSVERTEAILQILLDRHRGGDALAKPSTIHYNAVLAALSRRPSNSNAKKACRLLRRMELSVDDGGVDVLPDRLSYGLAILACARCSDVDFASRMAEAVLLKMEQRSKMEAETREKVSSAALPSVRLDLESFNICLMALSRCRRRDAPQRAERIIERMEAYADQWGDELRPTIRTWNALLHCYARVSGRFQSTYKFSQKAERLLRRILKMSREGRSEVRPNAFTYTGVLSVYQRSGDPKAAERADEIVSEMEELYNRGEIDDPPDTYHYTILCGAYARSGRKDAASRVLQILSHMIELSNSGRSGVSPNTRTFNSVIDCLTKSGEAERAEAILNYMIDLSRGGNNEATPDSFSFRRYVYSTIDFDHANPIPSVILAFAKSKLKDAAKRAEQVLDCFLQYHEEENQSVRPDSRCFKICIERYCESGQPDSPYRAEYLLNRMIARFRDGQRYLEPPLFAFSSVIKCYAYAAHPDAGRNAERLLKTVRTLMAEGAQNLVVNTAILNSVLLAYSMCKDDNAGLSAENHLNEMESAFTDGDNNMQPTSRSYTLVLSAWSKSNCSYKFRRALSVLRRMDRMEKAQNKLVEVDAYPLGLVINACGFSNDSVEVEAEAFSVAVKIYCTMTRKHDPNSLCFGWFIETCGRLRVESDVKDAQIKRAFRDCCKAGMVNGFVLQKLKIAAPPLLFKQLLNHKASAVQLSNLPDRWTRNTSKNKSN